MTPFDFISTWGPGGSRDAENERQGAQPYFLDLCELLEVPKPGTTGADSGYVFEKQTLALGQERGFADVFYKNRFAWENKAPGKNLDAALRQLLGYSLTRKPLLKQNQPLAQIESAQSATNSVVNEGPSKATSAARA